MKLHRDCMAFAPLYEQTSTITPTHWQTEVRRAAARERGERGQKAERGRWHTERERGQRKCSSDLARILVKHPPRSLADSWCTEQNQGVKYSHYDGGAAAKDFKDRARAIDWMIKLVDIHCRLSKIMCLSERGMCLRRKTEKSDKTDRGGRGNKG